MRPDDDMIRLTSVRLITGRDGKRFLAGTLNSATKLLIFPRESRPGDEWFEVFLVANDEREGSRW